MGEGLLEGKGLNRGNTMIASVSFVLTGNLICNFSLTGQISNFSLINMHKQTSSSKRIRNNANHISSSIMVLGKLIP